MGDQVAQPDFDQQYRKCTNGSQQERIRESLAVPIAARFCNRVGKKQQRGSDGRKKYDDPLHAYGVCLSPTKIAATATAKRATYNSPARTPETSDTPPEIGRASC